MLVKEFEGNSVSEVIRNIKQELGSDATILSTDNKFKSDGKVGVLIRAASPTASKVVRNNSFNKTKEECSLFGNKIDDINHRLSLMESKLLSRDDINIVDSNIRELRLLVHQHLDSRMKLPSDLPEAARLVINCLKMSGINIRSLIDLAAYFSSLPMDVLSLSEYDKNFSFYHTHARSWIKSKLNSFPKSSLESGCHFFVGSNSCGRTTLISKLLYYLKRNHSSCRPKVIVYDSTGLSDSEQMSLITKVFSIKGCVVNSPQDLLAQVKNNDDSDLTLVDVCSCPPRSIQNTVLAREILQDVSSSISTHLVLSLLHKQEYNTHLIRNFAPTKTDSLVFTGLDLWARYGEMFNISSEWSLPISMIASGTHIGGSVVMSSPERIAKIVLEKESK